MERKKLSGKEVRCLLKQNSVNLSWLAEQLGISAQVMSRHADAAIRRVIDNVKTPTILTDNGSGNNE